MIQKKSIEIAELLPFNGDFMVINIGLMDPNGGLMV